MATAGIDDFGWWCEHPLLACPQAIPSIPSSIAITVQPSISRARWPGLHVVRSQVWAVVRVKVKELNAMTQL